MLHNLPTNLMITIKRISFECLKITPKINIFINKIKMEDIECVFESVSGAGSLFISNHSAAQSLHLLQSKGIRAILSVARSGLVTHQKEDIPHYLFVPAEDHEDYPINLHFEQTFNFIEKARKQTHVLIHCMAGISRSVTIAIAYLMKRYKYTLGQVVMMLQRKRRKINPNRGFISQLKKYSEQLGIRCDFQGQSISPVRENSTSKQVRAYSAKKTQISRKRFELFTPCIQMENEFRNVRFSEIYIAHDEEIVSPGLKDQNVNLKKTKTSFESSNNDEQHQLHQKTPNKAIAELQSKKSFSVENSTYRKKSKIQEKINKIREKLIKPEEYRSMQGILIQNKQNKSLLKRKNGFQTLNYDKIDMDSSKMLSAKLSQLSKHPQLDSVKWHSLMNSVNLAIKTEIHCCLE